MPYLIRHKDGREYEVAAIGDFRRLYEPEGFKVVGDAPAEYDAPPKANAAKPAAAPKMAATTKDETPATPAASGDGRAS